MPAMDAKKYRALVGPRLEQRVWPTKQIVSAPAWCSVDLRDGNQALPTPMSLDQKARLFQELLRIGFKEIEVGFPAASDTEFAFCRYLIEKNMIPHDVAVQVLTPARDFHVQHTFDAIRGAKKAIIHLYLTTSAVQRKVVLDMSRAEVIQMAIEAASQIKLLSEDERYRDTEFVFEFSPESFMSTEADFAVAICDAVCDVWQPSEHQPVIVNLPNTVELASANVYADQVEYFVKHSKWAKRITISVHTHNDRGGAVVAAEMGQLAGAQRVEGTLFGNGERTGNCDLVTLAMNLLTSGIDPKLDLSQMDRIRNLYEQVTNLSVPERQPYAGDLVFTAFSGSHQDAIRKGIASYNKGDHWDIPYLPLDPRDVGREYDPIIRINSQSGRSGIFYVFEQKFGIRLPRYALTAVSRLSKQESQRQAKELLAEDLMQLFRSQFLNRTRPIELKHYKDEMQTDKLVGLDIYIVYGETEFTLHGSGTGAVDACCSIFREFLNMRLEVVNYEQQALGRGSQSKVLTYVEVTDNGESHFGAGESSSATKSALRALVTAVNRLLDKKL